MARLPNTSDDTDRTRQHDLAYQALRARILTGGLQPGKAVTLRGLVRVLGFGFTPVREAVRRLIAERALEMGPTGRIGVPEMSRGKFQEIIYARRVLELELARLALPNLSGAALDEIEATDAAMEDAKASGDAETYMRGNFEFHFSIYRQAGAETLLGLCESVWLQLGPFMRVAYGRSGTTELRNEHARICAALRSGDAAQLAACIEADIHNGMRIIGELALEGDARPAKPPRKRG